MENQSGDRLDPNLLSAWAESDLPSRRTAEYELQLRSTERVRMVVRRSCVQRSAPTSLVVRIRDSLVILKQ